MKMKLLIAIILCYCAVTANAQIEKGKNLIGGGFQFNSKKSGETGSENKTSSSLTSLNYGHFIADRVAIGFSLGFANGKQTQQTNYAVGGTLFNTQLVNKINDFYIGPFFRHYIDLSNKFKFQSNFAAYYVKGKNEIATLGTPVFSSRTHEDYSAQIRGGFTFLPSKRFSIDMIFDVASYQKTTYDVEETNGAQNVSSESKTSGFRFGLTTFNPTIGVNFHF